MNARNSSGDTFADFPSTQWSLIRNAQQQDGEVRRSLLNQLIIQYWKPIYALYRGMGRSPADASDLTQGFLTLFVANENITKIGIHREDPSKSKTFASPSFRSWLKTCARNYLSSDWRKQNSARRRPPGRLISIHALAATDGQPFDIDSGLDLADSFNDGWRRELLTKALNRLLEICDETETNPQGLLDRKQCLRVFLAYYGHDSEQQPTWEAVAEQFDLDDWKQAARAADWVKRKLREVIRQLVSEYTDDVDNELRELVK